MCQKGLGLGLGLQYLVVFPFSQGNVDVFGTMCLFQGSFSCWLVLLITKESHHSGQSPQDGQSLLSETSTLLFETGKQWESILFLFTGSLLTKCKLNRIRKLYPYSTQNISMNFSGGLFMCIVCWTVIER